MFTYVTTLKVKIFVSLVQDKFLVHKIKKLKPTTWAFFFFFSKPTLCFSKITNLTFKDEYGIKEAVNW